MIHFAFSRPKLQFNSTKMYYSFDYAEFLFTVGAIALYGGWLESQRKDTMLIDGGLAHKAFQCDMTHIGAIRAWAQTRGIGVAGTEFAVATKTDTPAQ